MTSTLPFEQPTAAELADRAAIAEVTSVMCLLVDAREWEHLERLFSDPVDVDYTSLFGGDAQRLSPSELVGGWRTLLSRLDATQHLLGGHVIALDGDRATCAANVTGTHILANSTGGSRWTVGGRYDFALERADNRWRISGLTLTLRWADGNRHIMDAAAAGG